jgi:predicted ATPase/class 3 adenylate cyclase
VAHNLARQLVAVMFTDMVGYTALILSDEKLGLERRAAYWAALEVAHERHEGTIVQRLGDGSMSMFPSALAALLAGVDVQRELQEQGVPVRIGVHVGEVILEPDRLTGVAVNVASRIESFAMPGSVMLSDAARDQVANRADVVLVDLGLFKLKGVGRPVGLYAVSADGVGVPTPDELEGKGERFAHLPGTVPERSTSVVGRGRDVEAVAELLRLHRVVTVTGPGGMGKTTVAQEVGRVLEGDFPDGVAFVALDHVRDPADVVPYLADALGVKESEERSWLDGIVALIGNGRALLLLDNLEQVVEAAADVATLVDRCPGLRIVATSRTPLHIGAEREYPLAPLGLPSRGDSLEDLEASSSVALFVERARATRPGFELDGQNAGAVAEVCRRLDGLPLALELAAARLRVLTPEALLERLNHALDVLTAGPRDHPARQQTLRATIDWSHSLLSDSEQRLFRRMAVFVGGAALHDIEAVCADPGVDILDDLESLLDKALVQPSGVGDRFHLLQTIAEFAQEQLDRSGEAADLAERHAARFSVVAGELQRGIEGADQLRQVERGIADEGNIVSALDFLQAGAREGDPLACEAGMRMTGDLMMFWHLRGKNLTARDYAAAFLAADRTGQPTAGRAGALLTAGLASWMLGQSEKCVKEWREALVTAEAAGADREICMADMCQGLGAIGGDHDYGIAATSDGIERARQLGLEWHEGFCGMVNGILHVITGDVATARERFEAALEIQQRLGDHEGIGMTVSSLAQLAAAEGDYGLGLRLYGEALAAFEACTDRAEEARVLAEMAWTHLSADDPALARWYFLESVRAYDDVASVRGVGLSLVGLAAAEEAQGRPFAAVQIASAAEVYAQQEGIVNVYADGVSGRDRVDQARAQLTDEEATRAAESGRRLTIDQVLELARVAAGTTV